MSTTCKPSASNATNASQPLKPGDKAEDNDDDMVNHPSHYKVGGIENIDYIKAKLTDDQFQGFLLGNALKYLGRANHKDNFDQDLGKAQFYVNRLVEERKETS